MHLVEITVMEQRYQAVMAVVQDGWKVTEVAERLGVSRQSVHKWIARYERGGLGALADESHRPATCGHQISPELEALICELRRKNPGWGPRRILHQLVKQGIEPLPGRSSVYRCRKALALKKAQGPFPYPDFNPTKPDPSKLPGVADSLEKTQRTFETWLRDMRNLGSPPSGQAAWADLVAAVQRHVELNGEQIIAARQGDLKTFSDDYVKGTEVQDQSLKAASDAGVPECSAVDH